VRHGKPKKLWPGVLGLVSAVLVLAAIISLIVVDPGKPEPICRYASGSVTVEVDGPDCVPVLRFIANRSEAEWGTTSAPQGEVYSQLERGKDIVRIYDHGNMPLARWLSSHFQNSGWRVVAPSPAPS
jgi:hypothetical protein